MDSAVSSAFSSVLVTGSTGFVGRHLCQALIDEGVKVRAAVRSRFKAEKLLPAQCELISVDHINGQTDWLEALQGVDAVVHLAARVHVMQDDESDSLAKYREVNTEGTRRLAEMAADAGVGKFVYVSSIKVNGESTPCGHAFTADDVADPRDPYGQSKWEAELALTRIADSSGLEYVVLRPPLIYGPGVGANFRALMRLVDRGIPLPLGAVRNRRSLLYVGNLVDAILLSLVSSKAGGQTFLLSDGEPVSTVELIRSMALHLGRTPRLLSVPVSWLRLAGGLVGKQGVIDRLAGSLEVGSMSIRRRLDWCPPFSMDQAMAATVAWYRQRAHSE